MRTFIVGATQPDYDGLRAYLEHTDQLEFLMELEVARCLSPLDLVSFYAKLCYRSLVVGKNANVTSVRGIEDNLRAVLKSRHGSVFEHVSVNFVTTGCSRVFTHELVRHRVGTAFSQTSGRYVSIDDVELVLPPELEPVRAICETQAKQTAGVCSKLREMLVRPDMAFAEKKRITSAIRRLAPNGQTNEIGWTMNVRTLRQVIDLRTSEHAEWEICQVFKEVRELVAARWPMMVEPLEDGSLRV